MKSLIFTMIFALSFTVIFTSTPKTAEASKRVWVTLNSGHKAGFDKPHDPKTGHWHVHVFNKAGKEIGAENMNGTKHDGENLTKVPNSVVKKLKGTAEYGKFKKKQDKLAAERKNVKKFTWSQLVISPAPIMTLALALGLTFYVFNLQKWKTIIFG